MLYTLEDLEPRPYHHRPPAGSMTQVIADTTLLRYLIEIEAVDVLSVLFGQVITPPAVIHDLQHANTPDAVRA